MSKTFWAIVAIIVVIFGGVMFFNNSDSSNNGSANGDAKPSNHVKGDGKTGVTLVEYGDFQCPFCGQYYPIVQQVEQKYKEQITFQFRHLPLLQIHQNAFAASRAAEAASLQGKFWEMYDKLYQNQEAWSETGKPLEAFSTYAQQIGLNVDQFKQDFSSSAVNDVINADIREFDKTKEQKSTPTFFLDGKKISATSVDEFSKLIDEAIAAKTKQ